MNIESINVEGINDIEGAKAVIRQLVNCIFEFRKETQRQLSRITSQNVVSLDFNITKVENIDRVLGNYATKDFVRNNYQPISGD